MSAVSLSGRALSVQTACGYPYAVTYSTLLSAELVPALTDVRLRVRYSTLLYTAVSVQLAVACTFSCCLYSALNAIPPAKRGT